MQGPRQVHPCFVGFVWFLGFLRSMFLIRMCSRLHCQKRFQFHSFFMIGPPRTRCLTEAPAQTKYGGVRKKSLHLELRVIPQNASLIDLPRSSVHFGPQHFEVISSTSPKNQGLEPFNFIFDFEVHFGPQEVKTKVTTARPPQQSLPCHSNRPDLAYHLVHTRVCARCAVISIAPPRVKMVIFHWSAAQVALPPLSSQRSLNARAPLL